MKIRCLLILILLFNTAIAQRNTMHLLIMGATNDCEIQPSVRISLKQTIDMFNEAATLAGMDLKTYIDTAENCDKSRLLYRMNRIETDRNSVLICVTMTHGFRYDDTRHDYPLLMLHPNTCSMKNTIYEAQKYAINADEIFEWMQTQQAGLKLCIIEACNNSIGVKEHKQVLLPLNIAIDKQAKTKAYNKLFQKAIGTYVSWGADSSQVCQGSRYHGGFYSIAFLNALHNELPEAENAAWHSVFTNTVRYTDLIINEMRKYPDFAKVQNQTPQWRKL